MPLTENQKQSRYNYAEKALKRIPLHLLDALTIIFFRLDFERIFCYTADNDKSYNRDLENTDMKPTNAYIAIDLKSFYASVECIERGLNPLTANLVVADDSRTLKTICLAVSPSLKSYGIPGRPRLFEVAKKIQEVNAERLSHAPGHTFTGDSFIDTELKHSPSLAVSYITAPPRMAYYMDYSTRIYNIYLKYIAPEDIHVYSIDEVFIDASHYLNTYQLSAHDLAKKLVLEVLQNTGITATAGIGTNLYLSKIAMDIGAKHAAPDENGVRTACLDEMSYRKLLWNHRPLTDFWRVLFRSVSAEVMPKNWKISAYTQWEISQDAPLGHLAIFTTKTCYTNCSASMQNCSSTMPGDGSHAQLLMSKHTSPRQTACLPDRFCPVRTALKKDG